MKRYPVMGSQMLRGLEMLPFIMVTALKLVPSFTPRIILIQSLKTSPNSKIFNVAKMKSKLTVSKDFSKSTNNMIPGRLFCLAEWNRSYVFLVHSEINLPGI